MTRGAGVSDRDNTADKLAVCTIFKNEGPYILEWLAFHIVVGVDVFFIADNDSSDGSSSLLQALAELELVKYVKFPTPSDAAPQLAAYKALMSQYSELATWVAFIDADEFLMPLGNKSIKSVLHDISESDPSIGAVAVNWANYGSGGEREFATGMVLERFGKRAEQDFGVNHHYKSLVKTEAYESTHQNPHLFELRDGYRYAQANGRVLVENSNGIKGLSASVCWENFRINHYIVKSYGEFLFKKSRGRATVKDNPSLDRDIGFFRGHDTNDVEEIPSARLVLETKAVVSDIKDKLAKRGIPQELLELKPPKALSLSGVVDKCHVAGDSLVITGWAFSSDSQPVNFEIFQDDWSVKIEPLLFDRPDVLVHVPGAPLRCGFQLSVTSGVLPLTLSDFSLKLSVVGKTHTLLLIKP